MLTGPITGVRHEVGRIADEDGQREIVGDEEDSGGNDEALLGAHQGLEFRVRGDDIPVGWFEHE